MVGRQEKMTALRENPAVDVLIIGGGINGAGTFRDLALQGVDVLLVERGDYCSGASAASSHMAHGGVRYLENGEFRLVREALHERNRLLKNAPHYVKPLPTTIPIFKRLSGMLNAPLKFLRLLDRPGERGALVIKIGLALYDWYVRDFRLMPTHQFRNREESLRKFPRLNHNVLYTATYYDGLIRAPERLCLELILDGEAAGARALNYVSAVGTEGDAVTVRDEVTGEEIAIRAKVVVNAAGPWIDFANRRLGVATHFIGGTKGSHLVLAHQELRETIGESEFFFENKDGRIVLILPYFDRIIVGTSDISIDNPDEARISEGEIDYFLEMIGWVFPDVKVDRSHIVFGYTGVRPLPASEAATTGQISRDHSIQAVETNGVIRFPVLNLVGGKWTTFRAFSEEAADAVLGRIGVARRVSTRDIAIGGGKGFPTSASERTEWINETANATELSEERLSILLERYGTLAAEMALYIGNQDTPLLYTPGYSRREIAYLVVEEQVEHLADVVLRRTLLAMLGRLTTASVGELAEVIEEACGWNAARRQSEIEQTVEILKRTFLAPALQ
jgi:glycerol-3-phosphate dehydrogenase